MYVMYVMYVCMYVVFMIYIYYLFIYIYLLELEWECCTYVLILKWLEVHHFNFIELISDWGFDRYDASAWHEYSNGMNITILYVCKYVYFNALRFITGDGFMHVWGKVMYNSAGYDDLPRP